MKKTFAKVLITILINALFTLGAVCICQFNSYVNEEYFSNYGYKIWGTSIFLMGLGSICGIVISKAVAKKEVKNLEMQYNVKKYRIITLIYNLVLYFACALYVCVNEDYYDYYNYFEISHIILLFVLMSISSLLCFTLYKDKEKKRIYKATEIILNILSAIFMLFSILCSLYLILPIGEFKYNYAILSTEEMKELGIENVYPTDEHVIIYDNFAGIFQDRRKYERVNGDITIPDKLRKQTCGTCYRHCSLQF